MATKPGLSNATVTEVNMADAGVDIQHQILVESLTFLYRAMPSAAAGHAIAASFIVVALHDVVPHLNLYIWLGIIICVSLIRLGTTLFVERRLMDAPVKKIQTWANILTALALVQTSIWGASVFFIWPNDIAHTAVLVTIVAGIIAAGGIMLALHRRSFVIYCLPIAIPVVIQLVIGGTRLELVLAALLVF